MPPAEDAPDPGINSRAVVVTVGICTGAVVLAHAVLLVVYLVASPTLRVPWQPVVAIALSVVSLVSFGGFYVASRRARVAIAAAFLLTFLTMLPFALTIPELGANADRTDFVRGLIDQFSGVVQTVVIFYFGSEAVITSAKLYSTSRLPVSAGTLGRLDRDLAPPPPTTASTR